MKTGLKDNQKRNLVLILVSIMVGLLGGFGFYNVNKDKSTEEIVNSAVNEVKDYITTYNMTQQEIEELPTTEIQEKNLTDEQSIEQEVESESFEEQGEIAYNGTSEYPKVALGDYKGLTYYSQIDSRWSSHIYTSVGNYSQTIGSSGCGPTSAAMIVTATKGTITPPEMGDLFIEHGYRSANQGTYWSAFRWVADTFDIEYRETTNIDTAIDLLRDNHYVVVSVGNGLFTTGGHFIVLTEINGDTISVYDPYLYAGKFETSTRRGKATVSGNTVCVSVDNFKNYANAKGFFCYKHDENVETNNKQTVTTATYTRYVKANGGLNVRTSPNGTKIGLLKSGTQVTVYETKDDWSRIGNSEWVCSQYLVERYIGDEQINNTVGQIKKLSRACTLYENSNLTGTQYQYKANTTITILQNVTANIDRIRVNANGRIAYIDNSNYTNIVISKSKSTVNQTRILKACTLYSNSNLSGFTYQYKNNTSVVILANVNPNVDKIKVIANGRIAYVNVSNYKK